jgi:hypothetical protein
MPTTISVCSNKLTRYSNSFDNTIFVFTTATALSNSDVAFAGEDEEEEEADGASVWD